MNFDRRSENGLVTAVHYSLNVNGNYDTYVQINGGTVYDTRSRYYWIMHHEDAE